MLDPTALQAAGEQRVQAMAGGGQPGQPPVGQQAPPAQSGPDAEGLLVALSQDPAGVIVGEVFNTPMLQQVLLQHFSQKYGLEPDVVIQALNTGAPMQAEAGPVPPGGGPPPGPGGGPSLGM